MVAVGPEVDLLLSLVETPSVSGDEHAIVARLAAHMADRGFRVHVDEAGNVHGSVGPSEGGEIVLLGHVDTVPGEVPVRRDGDVLHGRGTVDAKGPLAAMVCAAERFARTGAAARVTVIGAVGEEADSPGARHLLERSSPEALIIGEPSGAHAVGIGYKGVFRFRARFTRPAAHTSSDQQTAAEAASEFWEALRRRADTGRSAPLFDRTLPSLVRMDGDLESATAEVSCRVPSNFDADAFAALLEGLAGGAGIEVLEYVPAVRASRSNPVVRALSARIRERGGTPAAKLKLGTSDWNVVGAHWPVPTAAYGPGDSRLCHTADERVDLTEYLASIDILTGALLGLAESMEPPVAAAGDVPIGIGGRTV
ncbi:M20/M25/M40 family metallo-hydrolase [Nocardiopsis sp. FIRDI 009]|uniref:M20/M25/M40 family metallo-hydrolase n=1 Tax=Nocardiopsis sp. FIRDI 009 TaxID=714197 RepID=UPI000E22CA93|nr:M20/M25/M40 family metallo-hydrolase [Nocardiopsis sp. FIRDI 009]